MSARNTFEAVVSRLYRAERCVLWSGAHNAKGYGLVKVQGKCWLVHRYVYEQTVGPVPEGHELDHLCRHRGCANPAHLEAVTHTENVRRGARPRAHMPTCIRGHEKTETNWYQHPTASQCRVCANERRRDRRLSA